MTKQQTIPVDSVTRPADTRIQQVGDGLPLSLERWPEYMTTNEAAEYLRRSVSWMLQRKDIPYYRGRPNLYKRADLDAWMDRQRRYEPMIA